ncbi:MAG: tetratricopeptide repeat protein [Myxococcaceae bacterium]|nr:tetratricopeptide repeat protein [Myxococcaceae bacterium]MBH2006181.1 tetratricopeptide repeat protein [Myxococcaceae bacterium]
MKRVLFLLGCASLELFAWDLGPLSQQLGEIDRKIEHLKQPISERALQGRLDQAWIYFEAGEYEKVLALLVPYALLGDNPIDALMGHSQFELGNLLGAKEHFKRLKDSTSLSRLVQISDRFNDFKNVEYYYQQISNPPDYIRYIYARQLILNQRSAEAVPYLMEASSKSPYFENARYLLALARIQQNQFAEARDLLETLQASPNLLLRDLARKGLGNLYQQLGEPEKAMGQYALLADTHELARTLMLAGDKAQDLKQAQNFYRTATDQAPDRQLLAKLLSRQDRHQEAGAIVQNIRKELEGIQEGIRLRNQRFKDSSWLQNQEEIIRWRSLQNRIVFLKNLLNDALLEYELLEVEAVDQYQKEDSVLGKLRRGMEDAGEKLGLYSGSMFQLALRSDLNFAYRVKSVEFWCDSVPVQQNNFQKIGIGTHRLKVIVSYQINSGELSSSLLYRLTQTFEWNSKKAAKTGLTLVLKDNPSDLKKIQITLESHVEETDLNQLAQLQATYSILTQKLARVAQQEIKNASSRLVTAKAGLMVLKSHLADLESACTQLFDEILQDKAPTWLSRIEQQLLTNHQTEIDIHLAEYNRQNNRIVQIEQVKLGEKRKLLNLPDSTQMGELESDYKIAKDLVLAKRTQHVEDYYNRELIPLKKLQKDDAKSLIRQISQFIQKYPDAIKKTDFSLNIADLYYDYDLQEAIRYLELFIKHRIDSKHLDSAHYLLGISFRYEGELQKSKDNFELLLRKFSTSAYADEVKFRLAEIYFEEEDYAEALKYYTQLALPYPGIYARRATFKVAWILFAQQNYSQAIDGFRKMLSDFPAQGDQDVLQQESERYWARAILELDSQDPLRQALQDKAPRSVLLMLGKLLTQNKRNPAAIAVLAQAIQMDPENSSNEAVDARIIALSPEPSMRKEIIARYIDRPQSKDFIQPILLSLAIQLFNEAKKKNDPKIFHESAYYFAQFVSHFPTDKQLDEIIYFYGESSFKAGEYHQAAQAFAQIRDWKGATAYRSQAALDVVYAYDSWIKQTFPEADFSKLQLSDLGRFEQPMPSPMLDFIEAVRTLKNNFPQVPAYPAFLFQVASIEYSYGAEAEAQKDFRALIQEYPEAPAARVSANLLVGTLVQKQKWAEVAQTALQYEFLGPEFSEIKRNARFKEANALFAEAKSHEDYQAAAAVYDWVLNNRPSEEVREKSLYNAAKALDQAELYAEAEQRFEELIRLYPKGPFARNVLVDRAVFFQQKQLFAESARIYLKIKQEPSALLQAAIHFEAAGNWLLAAQTFEQFTKEYPQNPETPLAYQRAIQDYEEARQGKEATALRGVFYKRFRNESPEADFALLVPELNAYFALKIEATTSQGQSNELIRKTNRLADLQKRYERIVKRYDLSEWSLASLFEIGRLYQNLFEVLLKAPCPSDVQKLQEEACDEYASILEEKAMVLERKAIDAFHRVIDRSPGVSGGIAWLSRAKQALNQIKPSDYEAFEELPIASIVAEESNLQASGNKTNALQMAQGYMAEKRYRAAQLILEELEGQEASVQVKLWLAYSYQAQKIGKKAEELYQSIDVPQALIALGEISLDRGEISKAVEYLQKAKSKLPNSITASLLLGNAYFLAKDYPNALKSYFFVVKSEPDYFYGWLSLAMVYMAQKDDVGAVEALEKFQASKNLDKALFLRVSQYLKVAKQRLLLRKQRA